MRWIMLWGVMALVGCTHLKGVVLEDPSQRPARSAIISIGRPGGIAVFDSHHVDQNGAFDFYIGPTDANNVYLYDGSASPELTARRIEPFEQSEKMKLHLRPPSPGTPFLPAGADLNP
jgi:hypothetical protein